MKPTSIRIDEELHEKIKQLREKEKRSISQQIVYLLEKSLEKEKAAE